MNTNSPANDYLWDPSQAPAAGDRLAADTQRLEQALSAFRAPASSAPAQDTAVRPDRWSARGRSDVRQFSFSRIRPQLAFAAVAGLLVAGIYFAWSVPGPGSATWNVARISGSPRVGVDAVTGRTQLHPGQILSTDAASQARIEVEDLGEISVAQDSRVRLLAAGSATGTLGLDQGTISAMIWAPPRRFTVRTPAADAVDLGCSYTLHVSPRGDGWLRVSMGWVAFTDPRAARRESFIPVGAMCLLKSRRGQSSTTETALPRSQSSGASDSSIGTPFYEDASENFRRALAQFDFADSTASDASTASASTKRAASLHILLAEARPHDALTLWHLLARTDPTDRAAVYDRLAALVPPPKDVLRDTMLSSDPASESQRRQMRDMWWNALGLRDTEWWRYWERSTPPH